MKLSAAGHFAFICAIAFSFSPRASHAGPQRSTSVLVPSPIAESVDSSNSWETNESSVVSIHDGGLESSYSINDELTLAPFPAAVSAQSDDPEASKVETIWPEWILSESGCDSCGQLGCTCGPSNRGIFGNLCDRRHGCLVARFDTLILWRNAAQSRPLFTSGGATALDADQLESNVLAAPRISLFHVNKCGYGAEFTYIYAGNFYSEQSRAVSGYAAPGIYGIDSPDPTDATATLLGRLQSFEANSRTPVAAGNLQFIAGFRWIQWQEELQIAAIGTGSTQNYLTNCFNDLYGGQIGFDSLLYRSNGGVRLEGLVKAGAYYNQAVQHSSTNTAQLSANGSPASGAFAGEVGLTGVVPIANNWDFRGGYFGLWLESIAQPSRQLSGQRLPPASPPGASLSTIGNVVLQGVSLGIEGRW